MSQQLESGGVQPNVNPSLQPNHESGGVQPNINPNVNPSLQPNLESHVNPPLQPNLESGGVQPNINPSLQPILESHVNPPLQPILESNPSLQPNLESHVNPPLQPNLESGGVQPNINPSLQPNHEDNIVPSTSSSEKPQLSQHQSAGDELLSGGVQSNFIPGGSAHQVPQLSTEAQTAANEIWTAERLNFYRPLHIAAKRGDWKTAQSFIDQDPNVLNTTITAMGAQKLLDVAALSWQWEFVLKLLELTSPESIAEQNQYGDTVLHYVVQSGTLKTVKALVQKNNHLLQMVNNRGQLPLIISIWSGSKELVWYLSLMTRVDSPTLPFFIPELPWILRNLIKSGYHDIALYFVQKYPKLALAKDADGDSLLYWLATSPSYFFSGSNLGFLERWIYKFVHVEIKNSPTHLVMVNIEDILESAEGFPTLQPRSFATQVLRWFKRLLWKTVAQLAPSVKMVRDAKLKHECAIELVNHVCTQLSSMSFQEIEDFLQNPKRILGSAVTGGVEEIVRTLFLHFPDLIDTSLMSERNMFQAAIEYRQIKIVNILKEIYPTNTKNMSAWLMESGNTTLHLAGKLAPAFKLLEVSGAALQMQRELQWFKEVENITFPYIRELKNGNNETAKDVFRKEHNELAKQGEKWMKNTANSGMLASTLIATVLFAAAFTVPGGNVNDNGIPIFLQTNTFIVFTISDALGLFSSLTSLLMFIAILTARYAQEDFLESLPKKLIIGLSSLFFSIAAMIIAFGAALTIVLSERWHWVFVPITLVASFPVAIFVMLQLPLFVQMVQSTYGASIFRPWPSRV